MIKILPIMALTLSPMMALGQELVTQSVLSAVTVFPRGVSITRDVTVDLSTGRQTLQVLVPGDANGEDLRIFQESGLEIGAMSRTILPNDFEGFAQLNDLRNQIEAIDADITTAQQAKEDIGLIIMAANARLALLHAIGQQQAAAATSTGGISDQALSDLVALVGSETLNALQDAKDAQRDIVEIDTEIEALTKSRNALTRAMKPLLDWVILSIDVQVSDGFDGDFQLEYLAEYAGWSPNYVLNLSSQTGELEIDRQVTLVQGTGETWENAVITVSTSSPSFVLSFGELHGRKAFYFTPEPPAPVEMLSADTRLYEPPAVVVMEAAAAMGAGGFETDGLTASFVLPEGTVVFGEYFGEEIKTTLSVDIASFDTDITARAATYSEEAVFLFASFNNTDDLPYLPGSAVFYRDGAYVGQDYNMQSIAISERVDLGFGVIDGLKVERRILNKETGEAGVLTTRNDSIDEYQITVENLTGFSWDMIIYDRVPYSEQEDLEIEYSAQPRPTEENVDGKRGVMAWEFPLAVGGKTDILFSFGMEWPAGANIRR